jgi:hypothetical protein
MMITAEIETRPSSGLRFSGHETFACRYAWLPKAYRALQADPAQFSDEDGAMVELGLGKNMVRSLRFWVESAGLAIPDSPRNLQLTDFAHAVFSFDGLDPYLEDVRTLWLIHWKLASRADGALFAWRYLLNPVRSKTSAVEDSLDGPFVELGLLQAVGEKKGGNDRWETVYAFRREAKPEITTELFARHLSVLR